jgi:uncharacterized protein YbjT (DUF2867 family)
MICVTGASGTVGSALLARLASRGVQVRALVHSAAGRELVEQNTFEAVDGDFDRPETFEAAMEGCDQLFLLTPPHPDQATREMRLIDAAHKAGVEHVVGLSVMGAHPQSPVSFARWHGEVDEHLISSGIAHTILRPAGFMQTHLWPVDSVKISGRWYGMSGDGVAAFIDAEDVAEAAASVLTGSGEGGICELTGPAAINMPQAAAVLAGVIGRRVDYVEVSAEELRERLVASGKQDFEAEAMTILYQAVRAGHTATVTNYVEALTGRQARSFREFAEAHKAQML